MPPPLVIFDFDGTIADSREAIGRTANVALASLGYATISAGAFHERIGLPLDQIFREIATHLDDGQRAEAVAAYRAHFAEISRAHTTVFDGMRQLLGDLRGAGTQLAIATGKSTRGAYKSLERLQLDAGWFACVVGTDAVPRPKPHADMVEHICAAVSVTASAAWVVGDTTFDIEMGVAAGATCCGVTWGSHDRPRLSAAGARWVVDTRPELAELLAR